MSLFSSALNYYNCVFRGLYLSTIGMRLIAELWIGFYLDPIINLHSNDTRPDTPHCKTADRSTIIDQSTRPNRSALMRCECEWGIFYEQTE
ncbi:unnamed protein product [Strongylus vulgaris]|uniref:Uncharacterized protein n=1 Tax=Strongylus vulgaris TaxID=40348 RepID=A0A3P7K3Y1_STRVU|nr:unnamed protein product [Strongylus vulgaris]